MVISPNIRKKSANIMPPPFSLDNSKIDYVQSAKILGITISNDLSWDCHAATIRAKVNSMINVIQIQRSSLNTDTRHKIFTAFVAPRIKFCLPDWGNGSATSINSFDKSLKWAAHIISNSQSVTLDSTLVNTLGLFSFRLLVFKRNVLCIYNIISRDQCDYNLQTSTLAANSQEHNTRNIEGRKCIIPQHSRTSNKKYFQYTAVRNWNTLPSTVTALNNFTFFTKAVIKFLSPHKF